MGQRPLSHWLVHLEYATKHIDIRCDSEDEAKQAVQEISDAKKKEGEEQQVIVLKGKVLVMLPDLLVAHVIPQYGRPR